MLVEEGGLSLLGHKTTKRLSRQQKNMTIIVEYLSGIICVDAILIYLKMLYIYAILGAGCMFMSYGE